MQNETVSSQLVALRIRSASDPMGAKRDFAAILDQDISRAKALMTAAGGPGDGRVRQLIANTLRGTPHATTLATELVQWTEVETDEFARRAIEAAIPGVKSKTPQTLSQPRVASRDMVEAYRYATGRIRHQLRNALMEPQTALLLLIASAEQILDRDVRAKIENHIAALRDGLAGMDHIVEANTKDGFFDVGPIALGTWIRKFSVEYAGRYRAIPLNLVDQDPAAVIHGSEHLLSTIFWNLWINAYQAVGSNCKISVVLSANSRNILVLLTDNGAGLGNVKESAFHDFQPRPGHRGRGLLEVQDAVDQLHGTAELVVGDDGSFRVRLTFPRVTP